MSNWRNLSRGVIDALKTTFGEAITYTPLVGSPQDLEVMIDEQFESVDPNTNARVIAFQPVICVKLDDLNQTPAKGDGVSMRGNSYKVIEMQTDGQAAVKLLLHEV